MTDQTDEEQLDAERSIHALLCGRLDDAGRLSLLKRIARDSKLRGLLAEMIQTQELARAAYGYPADDRSPPIGLPAALVEPRAGLERPDSASPAVRRRLALPAWRRIFWPLAGAAVVAASVFLAIDVHQTNVLLRRQISAGVSGPEPIPASQLQPAELQRLRNIWAQVDEGTEASSPWILLSGQSGEFGYVNGPRPTGANQPIVVRVLLVSADGKVVEKSNLLLPQQAIGRLSLADAGRLWGMPLSMEVDSSDGRTSVALTVGHGGEDSVGISGRVRVGNGAEEIGWLRVAGKDLRVIIQALSLKGDIS